ncbi:MAG: type II toxin-antitoxin system VapC family toxin [Cyclobacteriaceae bacterium]|nr:type II toxin-antitoxin system VapC family toxin [Cyclobacteriaceae bacterium SS2]
MSGNRSLADTNAFIYLLRKHPAVKPLIDTVWGYSFITKIELLGKPGITQKEIETVKQMLDTCFIVPHSDAINELAIELKQDYHLKIPDAIIAATALYSDIPLITADKDFTKIKELDIILIEL